MFLQADSNAKKFKLIASKAALLCRCLGATKLLQTTSGAEWENCVALKPETCSAGVEQQQKPVSKQDLPCCKY